MKNLPNSRGRFSRPFLSVPQPTFAAYSIFLPQPLPSCSLPPLRLVPWPALLHHLHTSLSLSFGTQLNPPEGCPQFPSPKILHLPLKSPNTPSFLLLGTCYLPLCMRYSLWEPSHKHSLSLIRPGIFHCRLVISALLKNWIQLCFWGRSYQGSYNGRCLLSFSGAGEGEINFPRPQNLVHKDYNLLAGPPPDCYFLDDELPILNPSLYFGEIVSSFLRLVPKSTWMPLEPESSKVVYHGF